MATAIDPPVALVPRIPARSRTPVTRALRTLASRRAALTAHNPRQIAVPMLTPILFALVIAPALKAALGGLHTNIDYTAFVAIGTVGLLVPLATTFAGLSVLVDRASGAQRELLAAPVPRTLLVLGNLIVVLGLCTLQVVVVIVAAALRGADFHIRGSGVAWFAAAAVLFVVLMYGIAETLAARIHQQEEYIGITPVIAILPWLLRRCPVPDRRPAGRADRVREGPAAHARDGAYAIRVRRPARDRAARHLGDEQHDRGGVAQPRRRRALRRGVHRCRDPRVHPFSGELTSTTTRLAVFTVVLLLALLVLGLAAPILAAPPEAVSATVGSRSCRGRSPHHRAGTIACRSEAQVNLLARAFGARRYGHGAPDRCAGRRRGRGADARAGAGSRRSSPR